MPPVCLLQYNSGWQSQPHILPVSLIGPSPGNVKRYSTPTTSLKSRATAAAVESASNLEATEDPGNFKQQSMPTTSLAKNPATAATVEPASISEEDIKESNSNIQDPGLHQLIISRIQNGGDGPEVEILSNVSEEDYQYILDDIRSDDNLVHKPSYIPSLHQIVATLPSPIHEVILSSLLAIKLTTLEYQTWDADTHPYWPFEVSVSQTSEAAIVKLQKFSNGNEHVLAATHIHITEASKHTLPTYEWGVEKELNQRGVQIGELTCLEDGGFTSLSHTWFHPETVTITTWIYPPKRRLSLKSHNSKYYASAVLYPNRDEEGLKKVQVMFQHMLERIHNAVVEHLQAEHAHEVRLLNTVQVVKNWSPPSKVLNWNKCTRELQAAVK
ncbi:hypothetical protein BDR04DRAFT_1120329 [Suillus decipiens]|nr:hypothetical protein BDR04DRAFT_1120329 [Suillus decipiens]